MKRRLRVIDTGLNSARWNTAMSAALLESCARHPETDVLRFYRFPRSALLGASEVASQAANLTYCDRHGIEVARRVTGGGAVYMSPSMLAWDVVVRHSTRNADLSADIGETMARALRDLGLAASFQPPNSLSVGGRKISGAAATSVGRAFLHQGTLLLRNEIAEMSAALGAPADLLQRHLTSFEECGIPAPEVGKIQANLAEALSQQFGLKQIMSAITPLEADIATRELTRELGTDAHIMGDDFLLAAGARP